MTKDEALKLALEALETLMIERGSIYDQAITAIKEALANEALEKMAENARELGLDYEPAQTEHGWTPERIAGMARLKEAQDKKLAESEQDGECKYCIDGCPACDARKLPEQDVGITRYADISVGKIIHNSPSTQRTWVGLTGEELEASKPFRSNDAVVWELAVEWAEAKLKEKNT